MKCMTQIAVTHTVHTVAQHTRDEQMIMPIGGIVVRTDLRAGLAWDDLDDQAKELWNSLTNAASGLVGGTGTNS